MEYNVNKSVFDELMESYKPEKPSFHDTIIEYFLGDIPYLDGKQLGKVYRYMRKVRAGLDK